jgi:hypothetical protein
MLMRWPWMIGAKRAIREGGTGEVHVADGITGSIKLPRLVDSVVHLISAEHGMRACGLRVGAADPRRLLALHDGSPVRVARVDAQFSVSPTSRLSLASV